MSSSIPVVLAGLLIFGLLMLPTLGIILIKQGFWPKRRGSEPQCRACGYLLIGLKSERCPECGAFLSPLAIVHGYRRRRVGLGWAGVAMVLLSAAILASIAANQFADINWYHLKPTFWVMHDLRSTAPGVADIAIAELDRRDLAGDLSPKYQQQIVQIGLAQQATNAQTLLATKSIEFVERQYQAGGLSEAEKAQFGQQCLILTLHVRPTIVLGDRVPFLVDEKGRVSGPHFWVRVVEKGSGIDVDDKKLHQPLGGEGSMSGLGSGGSAGNSIACKSLGTHQLLVVCGVELHQGPFGSTDPRDLLFQEDRVLTAKVEVVAQPPAGNFSVINDPKLGQQIQASIKPEKFSFSAAQRDYFQGDLKITALPANIAFNMFIRASGREYRIGSLTLSKGSTTDCRIGDMIRGISATTQPTMIDLILRSDEKIGRETVDQHDIWNGELVFPYVPVTVSNHP